MFKRGTALLFKVAALVGLSLAISTNVAASNDGSFGWKYATSFKVIGLNPAYLESKFGPAKAKENWGSDSSYWTFEFDACEVTYKITGGSVTSFAVDLSQDCTVDMTGIPGFGALAVNDSTTYGELGRFVHGDWRASCLGNCGNAADPSIYFYHQGSRAESFVEVVLETVLVGDDVSEAVDIWSRELEKAQGVKRYDQLDELIYACGKFAQPLMSKAMARIKVQRLEIGRDINPTSVAVCQ